MKLLYSARMAAPWLTVAIQRLATQITKWSAEADRRLCRLFCYIDSHPHQVLSGSLATTDLADIAVHAWPDADLAGDVFSTKSTSGRWIELAGKDGRAMPLSWACRRQGATAGHTQEAETVSLAQCLREEALSLQTLVQDVLRKPVPLVVSEDNTACIQAVRKGYSPTLRHLKRTQRVSVAQLHETFQERGAEQDGDGPVSLVHAETKTHKGDLFTKYMAPAPFNDALGRLGVRNRRTKLAGGAARVKVIDVGTQSPRTAEVCRLVTKDGALRRHKRQLRTTVTATPTPLPPTANNPPTTSHYNNPTVNHNTQHTTQQLPKQHAKPRRRKRRRTANNPPLTTSPTAPTLLNSSSSTQEQEAAAAAVPQHKQPQKQMLQRGGAPHVVRAGGPN